jgi:hypothetical protein
MISLLWKEYREHRVLFVMCLVFAALSLAVLGYFNYLDEETAVLVLFCFEGPLLVLAVAHHIISSEVGNKTLPFLLSLPTSRNRIWAAKFIFLALFAVGLYGAFAGMASMLGARELRIGTPFFGIPLPAQALLVWFPLLAIAIGLFLTVLPQGFSTLFLVAYTGFFILLVYFPGRIFVNWVLIIPTVILVHLTASWNTFKHAGMLDSWVRVFRGAGVLALGMILFVAAWVGANELANQHPPRVPTAPRLAVLPVADGHRIIVTSMMHSARWDPLQSPNQRFNFLLGSAPHTLVPFGPRGVVGLPAPDGLTMVAESTWSRTGLMRGQDLVTFPLDDPFRMQRIDRNAQLRDILPDGRVLYTRLSGGEGGKDAVEELCMWQPDVATKVLWSRQRDFPIEIVPCPEWNSVFVVSYGLRGALQISLADGHVRRLICEFPIRELFCANDQVVMRPYDPAYVQSPPLMMAGREGSLEPLDWLATSTRFLGKDATGAVFIAMEERGDHGLKKEVLARCDLALRTTTFILDPDCYRIKACFSKDRQKLLIVGDLRRASGAHLLDLKTGELQVLPVSIGYVKQIHPWSSNRFLLEIDFPGNTFALQSLDVEEGRLTTLFETKANDYSYYDEDRSARAFSLPGSDLGLF